MVSIPLRRDKSQQTWAVGDDWKWVTVTRKPPDVDSDARYLIARLRAMLIEDSRLLHTAYGWTAMMAELRMAHLEDMTA